ncbi:MAG: hypothetical protein ABID61_04135 [Candidatus Micrarchaeota archaeon]
MSNSQTLRELEKRWNSSCKLIFNQEVGGLLEYEPWLMELTEPITYHKSNLSGKEVISAPTDYHSDSKWIAFDEVDFSQKFEPLEINEIKDIDSLVEAISERWYYSGNIVFGKSGYIENSSNINDSFYIFKTARFGNSKYLSHCTIGRQNEDCFGCNAVDESSHCIRCSRIHRNRRCFEVWMSQNTSDSYYSYGLNNCSNCIFSFNLKSRRYAIGNLVLEASEYDAIKNKLLSEMAEELMKKKRLPSLIELVEKSKVKVSTVAVQNAPISKLNKSGIEDAFSKTTKVLFGKTLSGSIDDYALWLTRHTRGVETRFSAVNGQELFTASYANYPKLPRERLLNADDAEGLGNRTSISKEDAQSLSLKNVHEKIGYLAFFNVELLEGTNQNQINCAVSIESSNCYRSSVTEYSKYCGYSFWPRNSQYLFGCDSPFDSNFSINCYSCTSLARCFEIDCCGYCSDCYFCHNCENVHDSMFCFNVKNLRNAIGNTPISREKYQQTKTDLKNWIVEKLEQKKEVDLDVFSL